MGDFIESARHVTGAPVFHIGDKAVSISTLISVLLIVIATIVTSRVLRAVVKRGMERRGAREGTVGTVNGLIHYAVLIAGFGTALETLGIDLTALFAAGAIFAIGLGFAMQSIAQNFVAGVILLTERAIKPGDVLEVEGKVVKVLDMGIRASIAQTTDGEDIIIPNATLIQTAVKNYTLRDSAYRIRVSVGVVYSSDMHSVKAILQEVVERVSAKWGVKDKEPQILMTAFGDNAVTWDAAIWIDDPWRLRPAQSELHEAIWWAFKAKDIVIAFPQVDVHLDAPVVESLKRLVPKEAA